MKKAIVRRAVNPQGEMPYEIVVYRTYLFRTKRKSQKATKRRLRFLHNWYDRQMRAAYKRAGIIVIGSVLSGIHPIWTGFRKPRMHCLN